MGDNFIRLIGRFSNTAKRTRRLKYLPITVMVFVIASFLPSLTVSDLTRPNKTSGLNEETYPFERSIEARENLKAIANSQIVYFAEHNHWAGYDGEGNVFDLLGFKSGNNHRYAYYCGKDSIIPSNDGPDRADSFKKYPDQQTDWPFGLYPDITQSDFLCMAIGNNDGDAFPDVWMINKYKIPTQVYDDAHDKVVVDIVSKLFVPEIYYRERHAGENGNGLSRVFIRINLCGFRLDLFEDGRRLKSYPIAIGMRGYKTPKRTFYLETMEWNPWFYPPNANWCKKEGEETCQPIGPGRWNPLHPVKMILQSSYLIHGTPKTSSIGRKASHGCIRMHPDNAADLAWKVMVLAGTVQPLSRKELYRDNSKNTYRMAVAEPVQVNTVYERLEIFDDQLLLHTDPYKWQPLDAETVELILKANGLSLENFDEEQRQILLGAAPIETVSIPIKL